MDHSESSCLARPARHGLYTLVFFRYVVQCSTAIACYCLCYLAYEHDNHHCLDFPWNCTAAQKENIRIPWAVKLFILACVTSTLESMFSTFHFLHSNQRRLNYHRLLVTTTPVTLLFLISYWMFYNLPTVKLPCPWGPNSTNRNLKEAPETYDCCIALGVIIAGGIAVFFQLIITIVAAAVVASTKLKDKRITLAEISSIVAAAISSEKTGDDEEEREVLVVV